MTILGATTNTLIGFIFPIVFYLKLEEKKPKTSPDKIVAYVVIVVVSCCSVIEILTFIDKKVSG